MKKVSDIILVILAFAALDVRALEIDSFTLNSALSYGYAKERSSSMQGQLELVPAIELTLTPRSSLVGSTRIRLDADDELEPGSLSFTTYANASKPLGLGTAGSAELRDLYWEYRTENGLVRLGKQQIVWGRMDGIKVLDIVNPQEFREFILDDFGDSRIGLWSAYFDYSFGSWRTELAIVPDSTGHAIPSDDAWFALSAPRFRYGATAGQGSLPIDTEGPGHAVGQAAIGLRLTRQLNSFELSAMAYSGKDPEPLGRVRSFGEERVLERFYKRRETFGLSVDMGLGSAVLRAEYAFQPERVFNARPHGQLTTVALDQHRAAIGLDLNAPFDVFVNVQFLVDTVSNAPPGLVRPSTDRLGTLYLRRGFAYDALSLQARWYHSFTDDDGLASVSLAYAWNDSSSVEIAAQFFDGSSDGLFGQFSDRDRITLSLNHTF